MFGLKKFVILAAAAMLISNINIAYSNPVATVTVKNNLNATAIYSTTLSDCKTAVVNPAFASIPMAGTGGPYSVNSSYATSLICKVYYSAGTKSCQFNVSRLTNLGCDPYSGVCTETWGYPQVATSAGGAGTTCNHTFTSVSDTNAVVTSTNGKFSVTLTMP